MFMCNSTCYLCLLSLTDKGPVVYLGCSNLCPIIPEVPDCDKVCSYLHLIQDEDGVLVTANIYLPLIFMLVDL